MPRVIQAPPRQPAPRFDTISEVGAASTAEPTGRPVVSAMMGPFKLRVHSPCTESWEAMAGDDKQRHCGRCDQRVHNLSAMSSGAAMRLMAAPQERMCVRFATSGDGGVAFAQHGIRRALRVTGLIVLSLWFWATVVLVQLPWLALTRRVQPAPPKPRQDELDRKELELRRRAAEERARMTEAIKADMAMRWTAGGISRGTRQRFVREAQERHRHSKKKPR